MRKNLGFIPDVYYLRLNSKNRKVNEFNSERLFSNILYKTVNHKIISDVIDNRICEYDLFRLIYFTECCFSNLSSPPRIFKNNILDYLFSIQRKLKPQVLL